MASFNPYSTHGLTMVEAELPPAARQSPSVSRNNSITFDGTATANAVRRDSNTSSRNPSVGSVRTRSIAYGAGVVFERPPGYEPSDDDIIVVTVRLSHRRRQEAEAIGGGDSQLPQRPQPRSFMRRMSTRFSNLGNGGDDDIYKAIKLPRREYKRYFARDSAGNYVGSEPQREWAEADLQREFGMYQDSRVRPIPHF